MTKYVILIAAAAIIGCSKDRKPEIEHAMKNYDRYLLHMDADSLASCYLPDGILTGEGQKVLVGPDSIRAFLKSFKGASVLENESVIDSVTISDNAAFHHGTYRQVAKLENGDTIESRGQIDASWILNKKVWLLKKMYTSHYANKRLNKK